MAAPDQPRIAVIGAGGWGRNHVRTWHELGALAAVCDADADRRAAVTEAYPDVEVCADADAVIGRDSLDAVVIATPVATHAPLALAAIEAGHDVLIEKPIAHDLAAATRIVELAEERKVVLSVGHVLEYHPAVRAISGLLAEGHLGDLRWMSSHRLNLGRVRTVENVLWSFSPHDIAMLLRFAGGPPDTVLSRGASYVTDGIADTVFCGLRFPHGVEAQVFASWLNPFKEQRLVVVGSERMAVFDDTKPLAEKLVVQPYDIAAGDEHALVATRGDAEAVPLDDVLPLTEECRHFLARVVDRQQPLTDGRSALNVLRVLDAADRSDAAGGVPVALDEGDA